MPTLPVRDLGNVGVVSDASPYTLPLNGFSRAVNVLFDEKRIQRAPVFKKLYEALRSNQPYSAEVKTYNTIPGNFENTLGPAATNQRFITSYDSGTKEAVVICDTDGVVREYPQGALKIVTPTAGGSVTNANPWVHTQVAGLSVLSRKGMRPYIRNLNTESIYGLMRGDWVATDTCSVLRGFGDFLVAMNVNKNGVDFPTMIKWCHPLQFSPDPATGVKWSPADTTLLSGENVLGEMRTGIRDGMSLANSFVVYSQDQVWTMELTESSKVFNFRKLFQAGGIIAPNCVMEVDGLHYVFGEDDLYRHDGITRKSISDERTRRKVFNTMDRDKRESFFVHHDSVLNLMYFCYVSKDADAGFQNTQFCNKAAVYNYRNDTWTFIDLPNCAGGAETNLSLFQAGYDTSSTAETPKVSVMIGVYSQANGLTESRVYAIDNPDIGIVNLPAHYETIRQTVIERVGIDLDAEAMFEIRAYKLIKAIVPQVTFAGTTGNLVFQVGASDQIDGPIIWQDPVPFDHVNDYKVDTRAAGRYLAIRITSDTADFFRFPGYDIEVEKLSKR
jgi:hypothetical protein